MGASHKNGPYGHPYSHSSVIIKEFCCHTMRAAGAMILRRYGDWLNGFEKGKTKLFNSWEVGKLANFHKKVECSFKMLIQFAQCDVCFYNVYLYMAKHI